MNTEKNVNMFINNISKGTTEMLNDVNKKMRDEIIKTQDFVLSLIRSGNPAERVTRLLEAREDVVTKMNDDEFQKIISGIDNVLNSSLSSQLWDSNEREIIRKSLEETKKEVIKSKEESSDTICVFFYDLFNGLG